MLIVALLVFFALMLTAGAMFFWMTPTATEQRLQALVPAAQDSGWTETVVKLVGPFADLIFKTSGHLSSSRVHAVWCGSSREACP